MCRLHFCMFTFHLKIVVQMKLCKIDLFYVGIINAELVMYEFINIGLCFYCFYMCKVSTLAVPNLERHWDAIGNYWSHYVTLLINFEFFLKYFWVKLESLKHVSNLREWNSFSVILNGNIKSLWMSSNF